MGWCISLCNDMSVNVQLIRALIPCSNYLMWHQHWANADYHIISWKGKNREAYKEAKQTRKDAISTIASSNNLATYPHLHIELACPLFHHNVSAYVILYEYLPGTRFCPPPAISRDVMRYRSVTSSMLQGVVTSSVTYIIQSNNNHYTFTAGSNIT